MLPGRGGLEILAAVRRAMPSLPVIVLTARGELEDRVEGLEAGAVDYLVKPFSMAELVARVRAQLRVVAHASRSVLGAEDIEVDLLTRKVQRGGAAGGAVDAPSSSCSSTCCATTVRSSRASRSSARCGAMSTIPRTNVVDVYVGYLRRKLGRPGQPRADIHRSRGGLPPRQLELSALAGRL